MKREVVKTSDGSTTIFLPELDENYHSTHGALQEAIHVFIENGLKHCEADLDRIRIFELGFGTGLNALLTLLHHQKPVDYFGLEAFPVEKELLDQLNYAETIVEERATDLFHKIHASEWGKPITIEEGFTLEKVALKIEELKDEQLNGSFDLIYFDAFGPRAQAELWEPEIMQKMADLLRPGGVLVTYCAQGQFKRNLKGAGFSIERLPGPPGKREMTRGVKN